MDTEREITVTCGATEAMAGVFMALIDPGDEVIVSSRSTRTTGPTRSWPAPSRCSCRSSVPTGRSTPTVCARRSAPRTKAIVVNTPHNPTGRVFTRAEMDLIAELCIEHDAWAITDEIYEHIRYAGDHHVLATWPGMRERTITISGLSKTFSCTGWRLGYAIAPAEQTSADSQGARLPHRGGAGAAAGGGRGRDALRRRSTSITWRRNTASGAT